MPLHHTWRDRLRTPNAGASSASGLLLVALLVTSCGGGRPGPADPAVQKGKVIYDRVCATCHGKDANGLPKLGKNLHDNAFTKGLGDDELVEFLKVGRPAWDPANTQGVDMPPKGGDPTITDEDLRNVVAFLRTL